MRTGLLSAACLAVALAASMSVPAGGQEAAPTPEARREAAAAFAEGEKAFAAKDYARAASRFEEAYRLAPHPNAVWNEARALLHAGDKARAANAYAKYLRDAAPDAHDRAEATRALDGLTKELVRLDVSAPGFDTVLVDDRRVEAASLYVEPGRHAVEGHAGDQVVQSEASGEAGTSVTVTLAVPEAATGSATATAPAPTPATATATATAPAPTPTPATATAPATAPAPTPAPFSPLVVWLGAGVSLAAASATVWSGLDTLAFRNNTFDSSQTGANYDTGVGKMRRTNALLVVSLVAGVFTGVAAIWLVDWHGRGGTTRAVGVGPGSLELRASFR